MTVESRARGIEQADKALHAARVFVKHEEIESALVHTKQRGGKLLRRGARRIVRDATRVRRGVVRVFERVLQSGEGMEQFEA